MDLALDVDPLPYSRVGLHLQLVPEFCLSYQNQRQRAHGIHLEVQQEADFLQHFSVQQMRLIDDDYRLLLVESLHEFDFLVQLPFGITTIELRLCTQLVQNSLVEVSGGEFGVCNVHQGVLAAIEFLLEPPDSGGLPCAAFTCQDTEQNSLPSVSDRALD